MKQIVLASSSPRRKKLLSELGISFAIVPSNIEETLNPRLKAHAQAKRLSFQKASTVSQKFRGKNVLVIAFDSIVVFGNEQLGKPEDKEDARRMLKKLSGKKHSTVTGFTIIDCLLEKKVTKSVETFIWMRKLSNLEIDRYIKKEHVLDKAGSYTIAGIGALLFEKIEGDYFNVLGLPLTALSKELKKFQVVLL